MDIQNAARLMRIEKECILQAENCNRDCAKCELVQDTKELLAAYNLVLAVLENIEKWEGD